MKQCNLDINNNPVYKFNIRDILQAWGATLDDCGRIGIPDDDPILDEYPLICVDDSTGNSAIQLYATLVYKERHTGQQIIWADEEDIQLMETYEKD